VLSFPVTILKILGIKTIGAAFGCNSDAMVNIKVLRKIKSYTENLCYSINLIKSF